MRFGEWSLANAAQIPTDVLLLLGALLLIFFGIVFWAKGRGSRGTAVVKTSAATATTRSRPSRALIYVLKLAGFAVLVFLVIDLFLTVYLSYQTVVEDITPSPSEVEIPPDLTIPVEEVTFIGADDLTIAGWYVPSTNGAAVILLHGYGANRTAMIWHAQQLYQAGYGLLLYDERASGESEGDQRTFGWRDPADVAGAIRFLQNKPGINPKQIGIAGCSIGGQIALQSASYHQAIKAVWADGAAAVRAKDLPPTTHPIRLLVRPSNYLMDWMLSQKIDMPPPPAMIDLIGKIDKAPIMLVAGGTPHPLFGPEATAQKRFAAFAGDNAEVWVIDEAFHCDGPAYIPEEYAARMVAFFDEAFGSGE